MFDTEAYRNIYNTVKCEIERVEQKIQEAVFALNPFYKDLKNFLMLPSKRIRSVLCLLYLKARGLEVDELQIELMSVIELIHNASLIHDDVIDKDSVRRGQETFNIKFGNKMAVIAGDYLLSVVLQKLIEFERHDLFEIFSKTIRDMCEGEIFQYSNLFEIPSIENYIEKTYKKTGSLFETAMIATLLPAGECENENAVKFARNFGIAFQIKDDLDNVLNSGKDLSQGVYNAPVIYSQSEHITPEGIEKTKILLNNYVESAKNNISNIEINEYKLMILELLELLNG